jgi:hypothetical protein
MKQNGDGKYSKRFESLWAVMVKVDAKQAGEISGELISSIIGCSPAHGERLLMDKIRIKMRRYPEQTP